MLRVCVCATVCVCVWDRMCSCLHVVCRERERDKENQMQTSVFIDLSGFRLWFICQSAKCPTVKNTGQENYRDTGNDIQYVSEKSLH